MSATKKHLDATSMPAIIFQWQIVSILMGSECNKQSFTFTQKSKIIACRLGLLAEVNLACQRI